MLVDAFAAALTCMTVAGGGEIAQLDWPQGLGSLQPAACPITRTTGVEPCPACSVDVEQTSPTSTRPDDDDWETTACGAEGCP